MDVITLVLYTELCDAFHHQPIQYREFQAIARLWAQEQLNLVWFCNVVASLLFVLVTVDLITELITAYLITELITA